MLSEDDLREINGMIARFYHSKEEIERQFLQEKLSVLGVVLDYPLEEYFDGA